MPAAQPNPISRAGYRRRLSRRRACAAERTAGCGLSGVLREVAWLASERPLHAVGQPGVAPIEHLAEQVREQSDDLAGNALLRSRGGVLVERDGQVGDLAAR